MKRKVIYSFGIVIGFMAAMVLVMAAKNKSTSSESKPCTESMQESCKTEKDTEGSGTIDFESLPGKFFSTVLIN